MKFLLLVTMLVTSSITFAIEGQNVSEKRRPIDVRLPIPGMGQHRNGDHGRERGGERGHERGHQRGHERGHDREHGHGGHRR